MLKDKKSTFRFKYNSLLHQMQNIYSFENRAQTPSSHLKRFKFLTKNKKRFASSLMSILYLQY